jgi:hypothetical protein
MRGIMIKALDNLVFMTTDRAELAWVSDIARNYRDAISADGLLTEEIYGYGVWLENARDAVKAQIVTKEHPDMAPEAVAAINTIIAIHGPMIASTDRGQELMARSRDFAEHQADTAAFKLKAHELAAIIGQAQDTAAKIEEREDADQANDNIGIDPQQKKP